MARRKRPIIDLASAVNEVLEEYGKEIETTVAKIIPDVARDTARQLNTTSPSLTGEYASGWTETKTESSLGKVTVNVYNEKKPTLTHLLEYGHALVRGGRTVGNVRARKHIQSRSDYAEEQLMKKVEGELQ